MYRSAVHSTTGVTRSSLFLQRELRTRFDLLIPDCETDIAHKQAKQNDHHASTQQFSVGDLVMARNFQTGPNCVPATIAARLGPLSYLLETQDKQHWRRHVDHIKSRTVSPLSHPMSTGHTESESAWEHSGSGPLSSENQPELVEPDHDTAQDSAMSDQDQSTH